MTRVVTCHPDDEATVAVAMSRLVAEGFDEHPLQPSERVPVGQIYLVDIQEPLLSVVRP